MSSANDEPTPEQRIEHLNNYVYELETAAAADREGLLEANRIIEVRDKTLKNIAASLQAERVDLIEEKINDMKDKVAWIDDYKRAFNELGMLLFSNDDDDDDDESAKTDDGNYIPDKIITAVEKLLEKLLEANASQPSSSGMSSGMFKL